jgi:hypothetical protein
VVLGLLEVAEPELMSVLLPVAEPVEPAVPEAPMEVPLPVLEPLAVVSVLLVLGVVAMEPELGDVELVLGDVVVEGAVVEELGEVEAASVSAFLPQADRVRAAIRARAAHCAIGDLIIRNS